MRYNRCDFLVKTEIYSKIPADISIVDRCPKSKPQNAIDQLGKFRVYLREKVARNGSLLIFNLAILYRLYWFSTKHVIFFIKAAHILKPFRCTNIKQYVMKQILLFISILGFSFGSIQAQIQWTGGGDGYSWEQAANWDGGVPTAGSHVIIEVNGSTEFIQINEPVPELGSLQLLGFAHLTLSPNNEELIISGDLTIDYDATLRVSIYDLNRYSKVVVGGKYYISGRVDLSFTLYVPQIGNSFKVVEGSFGACDISTTYTYFGRNFGFDIILGVQCQTDGILQTVSDIHYTTAKIWDGEAGDDMWTTAANWSPNGVPTADDRVIINLPSGGYCKTGASGLIEVYSLSIGDNNTLAINGDLKVFLRINNNAAGTIDWNGGAISRKNADAPYSWFDNYGTININSPQIKAIENTMWITNYGTIEFNQGTLNINNGGLQNSKGSVFNINDDNITIGYIGAGRHRFNNSFGAIIRKTNGSGVSSINLDEFANYDSTIESHQGTLAFGETLNGTGGTLTGSGSFQLPPGHILNGNLNPGNSPGILSFVGDVTAGSGAVFNIEIDGPSAGTEYDQIIISNEAVLDGILNPILGYLPDDDASFVIVTATTLTSCNFPSQITRSFEGTEFTFDVVCQDNKLYLNGPMATLNTPEMDKHSVAIYPNPVNDILYIKLGDNINGNWQLVNSVGQMVKEGLIKGKDLSIDLNEVALGWYVLKLRDENSNLRLHKKILVSN